MATLSMCRYTNTWYRLPQGDHPLITSPPGYACYTPNNKLWKLHHYFSDAYPSEIQSLIDLLNQELDQIEREADEGINIAKLLLSRFPNNVKLIGLLTTLDNALFFVDNFRKRIRATFEKISSTEALAEAIQAAGEDLSEFLGRVLESKMLVSKATAVLILKDSRWHDLVPKSKRQN